MNLILNLSKTNIIYVNYNINGKFINLGTSMFSNIKVREHDIDKYSLGCIISSS